MSQGRILLCWVCVIVSISGEIDSSPILQQVRPGDTTKLRCTVGELGNEKVIWSGKRDELLFIDENRVTSESRFTLKRPYSKSWNLIIENIKLGDGGSYKCKVGRSVIKEYTLEVQYSPRILPSESGGDSLVKEGKNVTLTCEAKGVPPPKFVWHLIKGNQEMQMDKGPQLVIPNIRQEESGVYRCTAFNGIEPNGTMDVTVGVEYAPVVTVYNPKLMREKGKSAKLECIVVSFPKGRYNWTKDGEVIKKDWNHDTQKIELNLTTTVMSLNIKQVRQPSGFGLYHCEAENQFGRAVGSVTLQEIVTTSNKPSAGTGKDGSVQLCSDRILFYLLVLTLCVTF
ncbi:protein amalgam-like [Saccostrea echinata]|uniref:protein amalgam-like n=1 Tax=Saccostrea echinata TaxID=191078 RepID=UPI002A811E24|nr:protein amalgam-like [Saccostrea echinata]